MLLVFHITFVTASLLTSVYRQICIISGFFLQSLVCLWMHTDAGVELMISNGAVCLSHLVSVNLNFLHATFKLSFFLQWSIHDVYNMKLCECLVF